MKPEVGKKYTNGCTVLEVNNSFAGFWRDGAVTEPNRSHGNVDDQVVVFNKKNQRYELLRWDDGVMWSKVYWLDTTATEATSNKPDPGEGWRLLDPWEDVEQGDDYFDTCNRVWLIAIESKQYKDRIYRRKIAPKYVPYTWDDRDELRGRWFRRKAKESSQYERLACFFYLIDGHFYVNSIRNDELLNECEWLDGTPCGKVVV